jgi:hypothetical protein
VTGLGREEIPSRLLYDHVVSRVPGRATSLASVGLLLGLSVLVGLLGSRPTAGAPRIISAVTTPANARSGTKNHGALPHDPRSHDHKGTGTTATTIGPVVTQSFRCPPVTQPGGHQAGTRQLTTGQRGSVLYATTFCRASAWYVSEGMVAESPLIANPFRVPDDPPIPASVEVVRFVSLGPARLPAVLVRREQFSSASLYELFTLGGRSVVPMTLSPGGSPVLLLSSSSLLQGAGFSCSATLSGEVIRQYEWYVVNPTTLETTTGGKVVGDPSVFLQETVYTVDSAHTFTSETLTTAMRGYLSAQRLSDISC